MFKVVDLRWGISEDATNDHSVEKLCLLEVEQCQRLSRGTSFVVSYMQIFILYGCILE